MRCCRPARGGSERTSQGDGGAKYDHPFEQIQDLVGARVVVFYKQDVDVVTQAVLRYYQPIEEREWIPERESEFGSSATSASI